MKLTLVILLAAVGSTAASWWVIHRQYAAREAHFGVFDPEGTVTVANFDQYVNVDGEAEFAEVDLPEGNEHHFGVMAPGEKGMHEFLVRNVGDAPLTLAIGAASCKCTFGSLTENSLAPGEETLVKLEWTVQTNEDKFEQNAELKTNDPDEPAVKLKIFGRVVRGIELVPKAWTFGEVAAGDPIEVSGVVYNHYDKDIEAKDVRISSERDSEPTVEVEEFEPTASDGIHAEARQAFRITARIPPGLPQGAIQKTLQFGFVQLDDAGKPIPPDPNDPSKLSYVTAPVTGSVAGVLSMITNSRLTETSGGYLYDFGKLDEGDGFSATVLIALKGSEREQTELKVGEVEPEETLRATLGESFSRGSMTLYRLNLELTPASEPIERLGKSGNDLGLVLIESDNPQVPAMKIRVRFALPAK